jgi:hypothetical protein
MCVQVTKTGNRFEISSLLEKILLKQVRWYLTFVGLYIKKSSITNHTIIISWFFLCRVLSFIFYWFGMVRRQLTIPERWQAVGMHSGGFSHRRVADHFRPFHHCTTDAAQVSKYVCTGNENRKPIWNKFIIRKDIIETSQVVLNFCRTVYKEE